MGRREGGPAGGHREGEELGSSTYVKSKCPSLGCTAPIQATVGSSDLHMEFCRCRSKQHHQAACDLPWDKGTNIPLPHSEFQLPPACLLLPKLELGCKFFIHFRISCHSESRCTWCLVNSISMKWIHWDDRMRRWWYLQKTQRYLTSDLHRYLCLYPDSQVLACHTNLLLDHLFI